MCVYSTHKDPPRSATYNKDVWHYTSHFLAFVNNFLSHPYCNSVYQPMDRKKMDSHHKNKSMSIELLSSKIENSYLVNCMSQPYKMEVPFIYTKHTFIEFWLLIQNLRLASHDDDDDDNNKWQIRKMLNCILTSIVCVCDDNHNKHARAHTLTNTACYSNLNAYKIEIASSLFVNILIALIR